MWDDGFRPTLADRTVTVVGWGGVGQAIGRRSTPFEVSVQPVASRARPGVHGIEDLPTLLPGTEVLILAVPLTDRTRGLVDAECWQRCPTGRWWSTWRAGRWSTRRPSSSR